MKHTEDITSNKHGGNAESNAANERNLSHRDTQRAQVLAAIATASGGLTMKELSQAWDVQLNTISGRASELKRDGQIVKTGLTRDGSAVLVPTGKLFRTERFATGSTVTSTQTSYVWEKQCCSMPVKTPGLPVKAFNAYADTDDPFEHQRAAHSYFEVQG